MGNRPLADIDVVNAPTAALANGRDILLIDDNPAVVRAIDIALRVSGYRVDTASNPEEAWSRLAQRRYAAILLDMNFGLGKADGEEGLDCLRRIIAHDRGACVLVITAHSGIKIAVAAMQAGARDFVMKPWRNADLIAKLEAAMAREPAGAPAPAAAPAVDPPIVLIGESPAMHDLRALIRRVGPTAASIVVTGRPGSGRTLTARAVHEASIDRVAPAWRVDVRRADLREFLAETAGTVILRHVEQLDAMAQETLLDYLPNSLRCITIAESSKTMIPALRHRLATIEVAVPPLAARGDDALLLARHFARVAADRSGRQAIRLTHAAETLVKTTAWSDDVRGLALAIERGVILAEDGVIDAALLTSPAASIPPDEASYDLVDAERGMIEAALREYRHNVTHAAAALGLSRGALYRRMARYGL